ncbi:hypothetical protein LTR12_017265 [Friedmanniomyces endolithicus]|nr:hypothetical protein LTR12_017265 [Friedmanniomyces endolithicus]
MQLHMNLLEIDKMANRSGQLRTFAKGDRRIVPEAAGSVENNVDIGKVFSATERTEDRQQSLQLENKRRRDSKQGRKGKSGAKKKEKKKQQQQDQRALLKRSLKKKGQKEEKQKKTGQKKTEQKKIEQKKKEQKKKKQKKRAWPAKPSATHRVSDLGS